MNSATCNCENGKCLASIMDDSVIICDEVKDPDADAEAKSNDQAKLNDETNFNKKKATCKTLKFLYFTLIFINYYNINDSC